MSEAASKTCFVIAPIGKPGTEVRTRSDQVFRHIIVPGASACGFNAVRADHISEPGIITSQIIQRLVSEPMVIADLTGSNANVFYELAVRHSVKKPVIQIIDAADPIPFDVAATRIIQFDYRDLDSAAHARDQITNQIRTIESSPNDIDTPITAALRLKLLAESEDPLKRSNAEIIAMLHVIRTSLDELQRTTKTSIPLAPLNDLRRCLKNLREGILAIGSERPMTETERSAILSLLDTCGSATALLAREASLAHSRTPNSSLPDQILASFSDT